MQNEKGATLLVTLCLVAFLFLMLAALLPMMSAEVRASGYNMNYVIAQAAADAVANYELQRVQTSLDGGAVPDDDEINDSRISNTSSATVSCTSTLIEETDSRRIQIRAIATCGNSSASASVNVYLDDSSPIIVAGTELLNMINTGTYSHTDHNPKGKTESRWAITNVYDENGNLTDSYSQPTDVSQVMFSSTVTGDTFDISYRASALPSTSSGVVSGGGYGIYYGMIGNADNMNAYVVQYDPGAQNDNNTGYSATYGTLLVKKVIFDPGNTDPEEDDSTNFTSYIASSPGYLEKNDWGLDSGDNSSYYACPFEATNTGEVLRVPLSSQDDSTNSLQAIMESYTNSTFDIYAAHTITIETKFVNGVLWHYIYCDSNPSPILKFYDHSLNDASKYILTSFNGTHMGLRVWDDSVTVNYKDVSDSTTSGQTTAKSVVWVR